jgi:hypothetical protein
MNTVQNRVRHLKQFKWNLLRLCIATSRKKNTSNYKTKLYHVGTHSPLPPNKHVDETLLICKGKVVRCLTKYHAMKTYPVINEMPRLEDVSWSGGTAPLFLILDVRWR